MNFASVRQANRKGMAPIRRLAGHHCHRIHESRLRRTYRAHSLSDFPFSIPYEQRKFCDLARILAKNRAFRWVLHSKCPFFSLLARHFPPAKHAMVPAMGDGGATQCVIGGDARRMASEFSVFSHRHFSRCDSRQHGRASCPTRPLLRFADKVAADREERPRLRGFRIVAIGLFVALRHSSNKLEPRRLASWQQRQKGAKRPVKDHDGGNRKVTNTECKVAASRGYCKNCRFAANSCKNWDGWRSLVAGRQALQTSERQETMSCGASGLRLFHL
jgi:hypothetical protein